MHNTGGQVTDYRRLGAESPAMGVMQEVSPSTHQINLPTKSVNVRYVPKKNASKYKAALKSLIPVRKTIRSTYEIPIDKVGFFSYITYSWMFSFLSKKWKPQLTEQDIITGSSFDSCDVNGQRLKHLLYEENVYSGQLHSSISVVMWRFVRTRIVIASTIYILGCVVSILGFVLALLPLLDVIVRSETNNTTGVEVQSDRQPFIHVAVYPLTFMLTHIVALLLWSWSHSLAARTASRLRAAFMNLLYKHLIRVSNLNSISTQQIVPLMTLDSQKLYEAVLYIPLVIGVPVVFFGCFLAIAIFYDDSPYKQNSLELMGANLIIFPLLYVLMKLISVLKARVSILMAQRLIMVQEMLAHIRLVKMTTWEKLFLNNAKDLRQRECSYANKVKICDSIGYSILHIMPAITATLLLSIINEINNNGFRTNKFVIVLALLFIPMKDSFLKFWMGISSISDALASLGRLKSVLLLDTLSQYSQKPMNPLIAVSICNANFVWNPNRNIKNTKKAAIASHPCCKRCTTQSFVLEEEEEDEEFEMHPKAVLTDITFLAGKNKLIGVCGETGSGKTSLILAILGQLCRSHGEVLRNGSYSYVSQNPWIWEATLRDNILFGEPFHHKRYYQVIHCCSLNEDIAQLPGGDQTWVGSRALSLAQKQRVALARALYANKDICLLDDVLSSVDADIGTDIFEKAILGHLRQKTVILATRQIKFLSRCDEIYLLQDGQIIDQGTHEELLQREFYPLVVYSYMQESSKKVFIEESSRYDSVSTLASMPAKNFRSISNSVASIPSVFEDEEKDPVDPVLMDHRQSPSVFGVHMAPGSQFNSNPWIVTSIMLRGVWIICVSLIPASFLLLTTKDENSGKENIFKLTWLVGLDYFYIIAIFLALIFAASMGGNLVFEKVVLETSLRVHNSWFEGLCQASLMFFQSSFSSDIFKWFSVCLHEIDVSLPVEINILIENAIFALTAAVILVIISPVLVIPIIIFTVACIFVYRFYKPGLLKFYNLEAESSTPLYKYVASTVNGRTTIQAFGKENDFLARFVRHCDENAACSQLLNGAVNWLAFRIQAMSGLLMLLIFALMGVTVYFHEKNHLFPYAVTPTQYGILTGLVLISALQLGSFLQHSLQAAAITTTRVAVFRNIDSHIRGIEKDAEDDKRNQQTVPANWPTDGSIVFKNVKMKFWPDSPHALKGMSFIIESNHKIGIVGLPGSGKKSVVAALYRLVELSQGSISIGGTNICSVPLGKLRSSIALVPQNPVFFTGTIRLNMDPEKQYSLAQLQQSLLRINMLDTIKNLPGQLNARVDAIGDQLSVGERQLIYLARALLKNPRVLILEESLFSSTGGMEDRVQATVDDCFSSCTVLVIAHQMKYVLNCDKVIVIKEGQVAEFDTPERLYKNSRSCFSKMMKEHTGNKFETEL